jgi:hypothetical protein
MIHTAQTLIVLGALAVGTHPAVAEQPRADMASVTHAALLTDQAAIMPVRGYRYQAYYPGWYGPYNRYYYRPYYDYPRPYYGYYRGWYPPYYGYYYRPYDFYYRGPRASFGFSF